MSKKLTSEHTALVIKHTLEHLKQHQWNLNTESNNEDDLHEIFFEAFPDDNKSLLVAELDPTLYKSWAEEIVKKMNWTEIHDLLFRDLQFCHQRAVQFIKE